MRADAAAPRVSHGLPLHFRGFQARMRNQQMPDERLKRFRMWRNRRRIHYGYDDAGEGYPSCIAAIASHDAADFGADLLRKFQRAYQVGADVALDRKSTRLNSSHPSISYA